VTQVQALPASTVFASRRHEAVPQRENPSTQPTEGEVKVTDSGNKEDEDRVLGGGAGEGVALSVGVEEGELIDGEIVVSARAGDMGWLAQPASRMSATMPLTRKASVIRVEREFPGPVSLW
jgi:hypothetical protein